MDRKKFFRDAVTSPPITNFSFDLQRFAPMESDTLKKLSGSDSDPSEALFSFKSGEYIWYSTNSANFTTDNLTDASEIKILGNITLGDTDVTVNNTITVEKTATLDLNGKTLTFGNNVKTGIKIKNSTDSNNPIVFTLTDNSSGTKGKVIGTYDPIGTTSGNYNIVKVAKDSRYNGTTGPLIFVGEENKQDAKGSTLNVTGGVTIESNNGTICGINNANITITDSTVQSYMSSAIFLGNERGTDVGGGQTLNVTGTSKIATGVKLTNSTPQTKNGVEITATKNSNLPAIQVTGNYKKTETKDKEVTVTIKDSATIEFNNNETDLLKYENDTSDGKHKKDEYVGNTTAIYIGGYAKLTVQDSATVTSGGTGIEMRAGTLEIPANSKVKVESTAKTYAICEAGNADGSTTFGAAIAISQHSTNQNITTNVASGNFEAPIAFVVENPQSNPSGSTITANLTGGTYESKSEEATAAIAAKSSDGRATVNISNVTFVGNLEDAVAEASSGDTGTTTPAFTVTGTVTIAKKVVDETTGEKTVVTVAEYDANTSTLKYNTGTAENPVYVTVQEGWWSLVANQWLYLVADSTNTLQANAIASLKPAPESDTTLELTYTAKSLSADSILPLDMTADAFKNVTYTIIDASTPTGGEHKFNFNITGNGNAKSILGGEGDDTLKATNTVGTYLNGGTVGNDLLIGGGGKDTFFYKTGYGQDSIQSYTYGTDVISLQGVTAPTSFDSISYAGNDYVLNFSAGSNTNDSLTFKSTNTISFALDEATYTYKSNSIVKNTDEITIGGAYYTSKTFNGASDANAAFVSINAEAVNHAIKITGNDEDNLIVGSKFGGTLLGGEGGDSLDASKATIGTFLNGGAGADSLIGGNGNDTFAYTGGDDTISGYDTGKDIVSVAAGINVAAASVSTAGTNDLVLNFDGEKLTFEGDAGFTSAISLKSGRRNYLFSKESIVSGNSITLTAGFTASEFAGGETYDTINASLAVPENGGISITGNNHGNYIIGSATKANSLKGGTGDDTFLGGSQADVFFYGGGKDVIQNFGASDSLSIADEITLDKARTGNRRLTLTMNNKANNLIFRSDDEAPAKILLEGGGYLTKDGVVNTTDKTLNLFSSAKGQIDLNDDLYSDANISLVSAENVKTQSVTLVGGSNQDGAFTFAPRNRRRDGFEYNGGAVSISGYESGKDRINLGDASISGFSIVEGTSDVVISLNSSESSFVSLNSGKGSEVLIHQPTNRGNSYSKMVFADKGVLYDKAKATSATLWANADSYDASNADVKSTLRKIILGEGVDSISVTAGNNKNMLIDASLAGEGISLVSGDKNDKFTGSNNADMFIYTKGKDIIQNFVDTGKVDQISLNGSALDLNTAKISAGSKSVKFKFGTKDILTVKATKGEKLSGELTIDGKERTYFKNAIVEGGTNVSLTSEFGGTYKIGKDLDGINLVDGHLGKKKLTVKGTTAAESIIGGTNKTMFKGGGGADSLVGGKGADTFFYAKGDTGIATIADFDFSKDKLKIAGGTISKIESLGSSVQFAMKEGRSSDSPAVGWFNVKTSATSDNYDANGKATTAGATIDAGKVLINANNTYYWFAQGGETLASSTEESLQTAKLGDLITWDKKVSKSEAAKSGCDIIELNYGTNLVKAGVATVVSSSNALPNKN